MAQVAWSYSQAGPTGGYQPWNDEPLSLEPGSAVWLRVFASSEAADADARHAVANLVVPTDVELAKYNPKTGDYEHAIGGSYNADVGRGADHAVKFSVAESRWYAAYTFLTIYLLIVPADVGEDFTVLYSVSTEVGEAISMRQVKIAG